MHGSSSQRREITVEGPLRVLCKIFQRLEHSLEISSDHCAKLCCGRSSYFRAVNYSVVTGSRRYDFVAHNYTGLIYDRFIGKRFIFLNVDQAARNYIRPRGSHGKGGALRKWAMDFDTLDSGVPLFPTHDVRPELPDLCGGCRGFDTFLMSPLT